MQESEEHTATRVREDVDRGLALPVMEMFHTIQGEGYNTGSSAYFIRLGGCDVGCVWCDVKESWDAEAHAVYAVDRIVEEACFSGAPAAVITGGEPTLYELGPLTERLRAQGIACWIETSGAHPLTGIWDWVCLSPKKFKEPVMDSYQKADELKVVVYNKHDLQWGMEQARHVSADCLLYLQPEWSKREKVTPLITEHVKADPRWRISLQSHKYMGVP